MPCADSPLLLLVPALAFAGEAVVTRVVDGDTIEGGGRNVRLQGIDAPETNQPYGNDATAALQGLILNRRGERWRTLMPSQPGE